jgi:gas vesicle protein
MRYEEEPRAFNVLSGLALGLAVGASVALLISPDRGPSTPERARRMVLEAGSGAGRRLRGLRDEVTARVPSRS